MYFIDITINIMLFVMIFLIIVYIRSVIKRNVHIYLLKTNNAINKSVFFTKIRLLIEEIKKLYTIDSAYFSLINVIFICIIISVLSFTFSYFIFKLISSSILISILSFFIPILLMIYFVDIKKQNIINAFPIYIASLLKQTKTNSDIILAIMNTEVMKPLDVIIKDLNLYIKEGLDVRKVLHSFKNQIRIKELTKFFNIIENCYTSGGNYNRLLEKYYEYFIKLNKLNQKKLEKMASTKAVLFIVIILNLYFLFGVVFNNPEYKRIILESFLGELIINVNIIIYFIILISIQKLRKVE